MEDIQYNKNISIIGAGGCGRELASWIFLNKEFKKIYTLRGFLDDNLDALEGITNENKVIDIVSYSSLENAENVLIGTIDVFFKKNLYLNYLSTSKVNLVSFISENAIIGQDSDFGVGYVFSPFVVVSCNVTIGNAVFINSGSQIGHDAKIGNYVSIMANVDIGGNVVIGDEVFIGSGAVILPGVHIAKGVRIGAGSIVIRSIKKEGTYFGNPAKKIF